MEIDDFKTETDIYKPTPLYMYIVPLLLSLKINLYIIYCLLNIDIRYQIPGVWYLEFPMYV